MEKIKHGTITVSQITSKVWVAKTTSFEIMKAEIEIKGTSQYNAYYRMMNFLDSKEIPVKVEPIDDKTTLYHFN